MTAATQPQPPHPPPPGQRWRATLPRFGLWPYAQRCPKAPPDPTLTIQGADGREHVFRAQDLELWREDRQASIHCVTTWSVPELPWSGFPLGRIWDALHPADGAGPGATGWVMLRGQDDYRTMLPLEDLLADGVLLADRLAGEPLGLSHGAPWRLVAPAHYGYKQVKHLVRITWCAAPPARWGAGWRFMDHPSARVAQEERGTGVPAWLLRRLYRPLIGPTAWYFARAVRRAETGLPGPRRL